MKQQIQIFENLVDEKEMTDAFATIAMVGSVSHKRRAKAHDIDIVSFGNRKEYSLGQIIKANYELTKEYQNRLRESGFDVIPFIYFNTMEDRAVLSNYNRAKGDVLLHNLLFTDVNSYDIAGFRNGDFHKSVEKEAVLLKGSLSEIQKEQYAKEIDLSRAYFFLADAVNCDLCRGPKEWLEWKLQQKNDYVSKHAFGEKPEAKTVDACFRTLDRLDAITAVS